MSMARDRFVTANRLRLHLLEWGEHGPTVLLLHGFLEHAHAWDWVAPHLAAAGYHVLALDWRGHGDSEWIGAGGYYHFLDYVADLSGLRRALGERVAVVGHSMGGGAAVLYAGTEPEHVWALVSVEGLGMPDTDPATVPTRVVDWLHDLRRHERRPRMSVSYDAAMERLRYRFPTFSQAAAHLLIEHGTRPVNGRLFWKFDPLHQTRAPQPIFVAQARAFWQRVDCPTLYVEGSESGLRLAAPDLADRLATLRAERAAIPGAGHHPQLEQPAALTRVLLDFLGRARGTT